MLLKTLDSIGIRWPQLRRAQCPVTSCNASIDACKPRVYHSQLNSGMNSLCGCEIDLWVIWCGCQHVLQTLSVDLRHLLPLGIELIHTAPECAHRRLKSLTVY